MHLPLMCGLDAVALGVAYGSTSLCPYEVSCVLPAQLCVFHKPVRPSESSHVPWTEAHGLGIIGILPLPFRQSTWLAEDLEGSSCLCLAVHVPQRGGREGVTQDSADVGWESSSPKHPRTPSHVALTYGVPCDAGKSSTSLLINICSTAGQKQT